MLASVLQMKYERTFEEVQMFKHVLFLCMTKKNKKMNVRYAVVPNCANAQGRIRVRANIRTFKYNMCDGNVHIKKKVVQSGDVYESSNLTCDSGDLLPRASTGTGSGHNGVPQNKLPQDSSPLPSFHCGTKKEKSEVKVTAAISVL